MNPFDPWRRPPTARPAWSLLLLVPCGAACVTLPGTDKSADSGAVSDDVSFEDVSYEDYVGTYASPPGTMPPIGPTGDTAGDTGLPFGGSGGGGSGAITPPEDSGGSGTSVRRAAPAEAPQPVGLGALPKPGSP